MLMFVMSFNLSDKGCKSLLDFFFELRLLDRVCCKLLLELFDFSLVLVDIFFQFQYLIHLILAM